MKREMQEVFKKVVMTSSAAVTPVVFLISAVTYGLFRLIVGGASGPMSKKEVYILLGCLVFSTTMILVAFTLISNNWDKIRKWYK